MSIMIARGQMIMVIKASNRSVLLRECVVPCRAQQAVGLGAPSSPVLPRRRCRSSNTRDTFLRLNRYSTAVDLTIYILSGAFRRRTMRCIGLVSMRLECEVLANPVVVGRDG
jgi:hypothetical protein